MKEQIKVDEAIQRTIEAFPLAGMERATGSRPIALRNVASTVARYLNPGSKILDFGSGSCHESAVLQSMGYDCTAFDDLRDATPVEKEQINAFAKEFEVDFRIIPDENTREDLPFDKESFDMVMMHHVLEHFHDSPRNMVNDLLELKGIDDFLTLVLPPGVVRSGYLLVTSLFRDWKDTWQMVGRKGSHWQPGKTRSSGLWSCES